MINAFKRLYLITAFSILYLPIALLAVFSFNSSRSDSVWTGFSLRWYHELFSNTRIISAIGNTLSLALLASFIATLVGTMAAYVLYNMNERKRKLLLALNNIPILNPDLVTGISLMALFILLRMPLGFSSVLIAHITFSIPYAVLCVLPRLHCLPENIIEAAKDLGANEWQTFSKVILPEIIPGILTALMITFTLSVDDFLITFFTTGNGFQNLSILIYSMTRRGINPSINALSTLMFAIVFLLIIIFNSRSKLEKAFKGKRSIKPPFQA